jgi:DHA1 family bicyclomycin/chloramphenicol resistance-like MFS transporter
MQAFAAAALVLITVVGWGSAAALQVALFLVVAPWGLVGPCATALVMERPAAVAGTASGLLGAAQYTLAATVAPLAGLAESDAGMSMAVVIAALAGAATLSFMLLGSPQRA